MEPERSRRRERSRPRRRTGGVRQLPWRLPEIRLGPLDLLDEEALEAIHQASLQILSEIGIDFLHPEAIAILERAGADCEAGSQRVRFDPGLIEELVAKAPPRYRLHARNPAHNLEVGERFMAFCSVGSAPNVSDLEGGRRPGNFKDYSDMIRLMQALNVVHLHGGYAVEPQDLPPATRHLDALSTVGTLSDKVFHAYSLGRTRILDALEIIRILRGISHEQLAREPSIFTVVNTSSPLRLDGPMIEGMIEMGRMGQMVAVTPFTLSGAMAPATLAGALAQQNAEALAGIAFGQAANPGSPMMYGGFTSNVDMKSGAPAFGTPEYAKAVLVGGQLARRYGIPYRSSNVNASNCVDAQAAYESMMSLWPVMLAQTNLVMHAAGWLEGGLVASFEKAVLDAELLQHMSELLQPLLVNEDQLALDAIREVGPAGHFFGAAHTLERYETAFYAPMLSDWRNFETWREAGAETATQRAQRVCKQLLAEFEPPPLDPAIAEELQAFVERRKREGGAVAA
ncbi:MAG TPA: trimethylamine methyltransferase family protein [Kiloniellales bacterium]|nr:trimethylamine methyltransferase family protein [Kiloniellales bacterium]